MVRDSCILVVSVLLLVHSCVLLKVSSSPLTVVTVNWTSEGVQQVGERVVVRTNWRLQLLCNRFSNAVIVSREQYSACNASGLSESHILGGCHAISSDIIIQLRAPSSRLSEVTSFIPGQTYYLVSFSAARNPQDAYSKNFTGGECSKGVRLEVQILALDQIETTQPATTAASTHTTPEVATSKEPDVGKPSIPDKVVDKVLSTEPRELEKGDPKAQGLSSSGHRFHFSAPLTLLLVFAAYALFR